MYRARCMGTTAQYTFFKLAAGDQRRSCPNRSYTGLQANAAGKFKILVDTIQLRRSLFLEPNNEEVHHAAKTLFQIGKTVRPTAIYH